MIKIKEGFQGEMAIVIPGSIIAEMECDVFERNLHITDIGYYPKAHHHYRQRTVGISQYVLIYCSGGGGWYELSGAKYHVRQNQFFILPAGVPHAYGADERNPWTIYWVHFKGEVAQMYAEGFAVPTDIPQADNSRIAERLNLFEEIFNTLRNGYSKENINYALSSFYYFLGSIKFLGEYRESSKLKKTDDKNIIEQAIHYMRENLDKKLTIKDIATYSHYSPSHFSAIFTKRTGYSPLNYYSLLKIQQACTYLDFTDMKINQVCHKLGIDDPYYFSRLFSKQMGISPAEYRKQKKG